MNTKPEWQIREEQRLVARFATDANLVDGVPYWKSNDRVPPADVLDVWHAAGLPVDVAKAAEIRREQTRIALEAYCQAQARRTPEQIAEERAEARAAFGPGHAMVNVLTGERYTT